MRVGGWVRRQGWKASCRRKSGANRKVTLEGWSKAQASDWRKGKAGRLTGDESQRSAQ